MKGKTVMNGKERAESLRHCKWVNEVVEDAPWIIDEEFLQKHRIDYVAHDEAPYQSAGVEDVYAFVKKKNMFKATQRTEGIIGYKNSVREFNHHIIGISTSDLITRIVRDYDQYVRRNMDRGVTAKELNVGFIKEKEIQVKKQVEIIKDQIKQGEELIKQNWQESAEESMDYVRGFLALFGGGKVSQ